MRLKYVVREVDRHGTEKTYYRRGKGPRVRLPNDHHSKAFRRAYDLAAAGKPVPHVKELPTTVEMGRKKLVDTHLKAGIGGARLRARKNNLDFDIDLDWALEEVTRNDLRCALTGIPFFSKRPKDCLQHPYAPSIDKIDPKGGYTRDNCRIVVYALNVMMHDWGTSVVEKVANAYRYQARQRISGR